MSSATGDRTTLSYYTLSFCPKDWCQLSFIHWQRIPYAQEIIKEINGENTEEGHCCPKLFQHTINFVRLLVSVTLEKREGACALFVQKTPDMFTNLPSARKTLLKLRKQTQIKKKKKNIMWELQHCQKYGLHWFFHKQTCNTGQAVTKHAFDSSLQTHRSVFAW